MGVMQVSSKAAMWFSTAGARLNDKPVASNYAVQQTDRLAISIETVEQTMKGFIAFKFATIPEVDVVYTAKHSEDDIVYMRVAVKDPSNRDVRFGIYQKEQEILREFDMCDFDFGIIASDAAGVDPSLSVAYRRA